MNSIRSPELYLGSCEVDYIPPEARSIEAEDAVFDDEVGSGTGRMQSRAMICGIVTFKNHIFKMAHPFIEDAGSNVICIIGFISMPIRDGHTIDDTFLACGRKHNGVIAIVPKCVRDIDITTDHYQIRIISPFGTGQLNSQKPAIDFDTVVEDKA